MCAGPAPIKMREQLLGAVSSSYVGFRDQSQVIRVDGLYQLGHISDPMQSLYFAYILHIQYVRYLNVISIIL